MKQEVAELRKLILSGVQQEEHGRRLLPQGWSSAISGDTVTTAYADEATKVLIAASKKTKKDVDIAMDSIWLILCGALVFFIHAGLAMYQAGSIRVKNTENVMTLVFLNICIGGLVWYIFGYAFAFGGPFKTDKNDELELDHGGFGGSKGFAGSGFLKEDSDGNMVGYKLDAKGYPTQALMLQWFYKWGVCSLVGAIVSGGVSGRITLYSYAIYSLLMSFFIWPLIAAWTWGHGWMEKIGDVGYTDFAGSAIVHIPAGVGALAGAVICGPRDGRFDEARGKEMYPHAMPLVVFGAFVIWFGWYGLTCGHTLALHSALQAALAAQVATNVTIAASVSGVTIFCLRYARTKIYDTKGMCHGIVAGLVTISAGCANVENGSALVIAMIGAAIYEGCSWLLVFTKVDDPVDASAVHGACGMWGVLAAALFDWGLGFDHYNGRKAFVCMGYKNDKDPSCTDGDKTCNDSMTHSLRIVGLCTEIARGKDRYATHRGSYGDISGHLSSKGRF
jgi:Amt family ammonium transporter